MFRLILVLTALMVSTSLQAGEIQPFKAHYHLVIDGWPNADMTHQLERDKEGWRTTMHASVKIATGYEYSRFRLRNDTDVAPWSFYSRYRLFGFGDTYRLDDQQLASLPDRQAALFALSRQAFNAPSCRGRQTTPCTFAYLDHKARQRDMAWRVIDDPEMSVPQGHWQTRHVEAWDEDKPDRRMHFYFTSRYPGLLVQTDYFRDGKLSARLQLTGLETP
ncbi:hypothetical protein [Kushneria phyllosphaerae]|uniref:DUF3108 domain-containing protein n=1 Tax=Kushneria phyllosphaerae TaxID=2100822 RepID=A0A2R8CLX4_9GAMM|nr:hypothetical protein [Kushneria phyllosphaerae]SPJ33849.1 hypothetical protein KSP9073_01873 [Kushneria phyllosphaerae]